MMNDTTTTATTTTTTSPALAELEAALANLSAAAVQVNGLRAALDSFSGADRDRAIFLWGGLAAAGTSLALTGMKRADVLSYGQPAGDTARHDVRRAARRAERLLFKALSHVGAIVGM